MERDETIIALHFFPKPMTSEVIDQRTGTFDSQRQPNTAPSKESPMTDPVTIARRYIELWNERAASRRR
ncbi:MAG: nuclear transport factor 2 family protein, partial [Bradyrhizobium guangdongense]